MKRLVYTFDGEDFEYEDVDSVDERDYILGNYSSDQILKDYIQYFYPQETKIEKERLLKEYDFDGTEDCLIDMDDMAKDELASVVVEDLIDMDVYTEDLLDAFEDEAYEEYIDMKEYKNDPYGYNGVSRSDFF